MSDSFILAAHGGVRGKSSAGAQEGKECEVGVDDGIALARGRQTDKVEVGVGRHRDEERAKQRKRAHVQEREWQSDKNIDGLIHELKMDHLTQALSKLR